MHQEILFGPKSIGGLSGEFGNSLFLDGTGNLYCTGDFGGTIDFDQVRNF
ncbi:MAG: hypothetical protein IPN13_22180 [Bacteroidetes bacterium]|nr:hypothetical protein [Bacteroidota bacterium]